MSPRATPGQKVRRRYKTIVLVFLLLVAAVVLSRPLHELIPYKYDKGDTLTDHLSPQRIKIMMPERLVELIDPRPSHTVLDIGAGYGLLTFPVARMVGPTGKVFATDVEPKVIAYLNEQSRREKVTNVLPVQVALVGLDSFYAQHSYDKIIMSDMLPEIISPGRFVGKLRPTLKRGSGRLWAIVSKIDPDFTDIEFKESPKLLDVLRSPKVQSTIGPRLRAVTRQAIETRPPGSPDTIRALLVEDVNKMLDDPTLWPQAKAQQWPLSPHYARVREGLDVMLQKKGAFGKRSGTPDEASTHPLRLLNRLVVVDLLELDLWRNAFVWTNFSERDSIHFIEKLDAPLGPDQAIMALFRDAGYELVKYHKTIPYYDVFEFINPER
jgi:2-polyprenyl-3-methyl-5-hydroxy-6-metoxy-1,4-benzoquinol methylase